MTPKAQQLQAILDSVVDQKKIFGTSFALKKGDFSWQGAAGNLSTDQPYFIASTTKLFTTAIILALQAAGKLNLEDKIISYLDDELVQGLHVYKGQDYTQALTITHLLAHTSGLPDYFQNRAQNGRSLEQELVTGNDQHWTFEQALERSKAMKPMFAPGTRNKAHYSDTNFQLLGRIIEQITRQSYAENVQAYIIDPLNLQDTYLYQDSTDRKPQVLYYKTEELPIYQAMTSFGPDGGGVSTSADMLTFIEAFFSGSLFPENYLQALTVWNRIFFPLKSGIGIQLFKLPWIFNPLGAVPAFRGHSGLSGALAYYSPKTDTYVVGTVNQIAHPELSFRTMIQLVQKL